MLRARLIDENFGSLELTRRSKAVKWSVNSLIAEATKGTMKVKITMVK